MARRKQTSVFETLGILAISKFEATSRQSGSHGLVARLVCRRGLVGCGQERGQRAADSFTASQLSSEAMYEAKEATCRVSAIGQSVGRLTESESESVSIVDRRLSIDV